MSSSPPLLNACLAVLNRILSSNSAVLDLEKNKLLRWLLKRTFYAQFCAGENKEEVEKSMKQVKSLGYRGVILEYCLEVLERGSTGVKEDDPAALQEIEVWRRGMLETVSMAQPHDFVALKWSGLGNYALKLLKQDLPPTPAMQRAMTEVCDLAYARAVRILPGAEWEQTNRGIDTWTQRLQRRYNASPAKGAIMYTTYQAYLRSTPATLARHLAAARRGRYTPGVKLVRGAYLSSETRDRIWESKARTDAVYDALMEALLRRRYDGVVLRPEPGSGEDETVPKVELLLATHNHDSVRRAQAIRREQTLLQRTTEGGQKEGELVPLAYAQLLGMADDVSCELVREQRVQDDADKGAAPLGKRSETFKGVAWGTVPECLHFLLRRAMENKDAASRTEDTRRAMGEELWRRVKSAVGLA